MKMIKYQGATAQEVINRIRRELGPNALIVSTDEVEGQVIMVAGIERHLQPLSGQETFSEIKKCLIHHRTPRHVIDHLLGNSNLEGSMPEVLSRLFRTTMNLKQLNNILNEGAPIMFVGPPGVGKTLALVKLAAQCKMEERPIKIISTDRQKSGGCAQIECLSEAVGADLSMIENSALLHKAVEENNNGALILIDTPGTNPFNQEEKVRLLNLVHASNAKVVLVLPATGDQDYLDEMEQVFNEFGTQYILLTQIDLCTRLGNVVTRALYGSYPLLAVGHHSEVAHLLVPTISSGFPQLFIEAYDNSLQQDLIQGEQTISIAKLAEAQRENAKKLRLVG